MTRAESPRSDRRLQLDGLRSAAATAVIVEHAGGWEALGVPHLAYAGVRFFFVLSGFLITGILLDARAEAAARGVGRGGVLRAFYVRRALRIFPVYYLALGLALALGVPNLAENLGWHLTYTTNVHYALDREWHGGGQHLWSLAVEEQFYLAWPVLVLFLPARLLPAALLAVVLLSPLCRLAVLEQTHSTLRATLPLPCCADTLGAGALAAWLVRRGPAGLRRFRWLCPLAGLGLLAVAAAGPHAADVALRDTGAALAFAWAVAAVSRGLPGPAGRLLESRPLVYLGTISYGLYLYHAFVLAVLVRAGWPETGAGTFAATYALTAAVASASWFAFERPLNALKRLAPYVRGSAPVTATERSTSPPPLPAVRGSAGIGGRRG